MRSPGAGPRAPIGAEQERRQAGGRRGEGRGGRKGKGEHWEINGSGSSLRIFLFLSALSLKGNLKTKQNNNKKPSSNCPNYIKKIVSQCADDEGQLNAKARPWNEGFFVFR